MSVQHGFANAAVTPMLEYISCCCFSPLFFRVRVNACARAHLCELTRNIPQCAPTPLSLPDVKLLFSFDRTHIHD